MRRIMPCEDRDAIACFIFEAIEEGAENQPTITDYVRQRLPWAKEEDVVQAAHHIVDVIARLQIESGSNPKRGQHAA